MCEVQAIVSSEQAVLKFSSEALIMEASQKEAETTVKTRKQNVCLALTGTLVLDTTVYNFMTNTALNVIFKMVADITKCINYKIKSNCFNVSFPQDELC